MSHWFEKCLACKLQKQHLCVSQSLALWFHLQGSFLFFVIGCFLRPEIVFWLNPWSLVACIAEMAEQLPSWCLCKAVVKGKNMGERERERTCTQNGEDRIVKIQELVYNRPNPIRSQVGSISTFGCMFQFRIFFFFLNYVCIQFSAGKK